MTVTIFSTETASAGQGFQAVAGGRVAAGRTAGEALDAFTQQYPETSEEPLFIVRRFRPDEFFTAEQQQRLSDLMALWRQARDGHANWTPAEQRELEALVDAEITATANRAAGIAHGLAR